MTNIYASSESIKYLGERIDSLENKHHERLNNRPCYSELQRYCYGSSGIDLSAQISNINTLTIPAIKSDLTNQIDEQKTRVTKLEEEQVKKLTDTTVQLRTDQEAMQNLLTGQVARNQEANKREIDALKAINTAMKAQLDGFLGMHQKAMAEKDQQNNDFMVKTKVAFDQLRDESLKRNEESKKELEQLVHKHDIILTEIADERNNKTIELYEFLSNLLKKKDEERNVDIIALQQRLSDWQKATDQSQEQYARILQEKCEKMRDAHIKHTGTVDARMKELKKQIREAREQLDLPFTVGDTESVAGTDISSIKSFKPNVRSKHGPDINGWTKEIDRVTKDEAFSVDEDSDSVRVEEASHDVDKA